MMSIASEKRILGIDDAPFSFDDDTTEILGCLLRGNGRIEAVLSSEITVDGIDATDRIADMVLSSRQHDHLHAIMLDGITYGGLNIVDIKDLSSRIDRPVVAVSRKEPDFDSISGAMDNVDRKEERQHRIDNAGPVHRDDDGLYFQYSGTDEEHARELIGASQAEGVLPEPVRVAHLMAAGIKTGESKGDA